MRRTGISWIFVVTCLSFGTTASAFLFGRPALRRPLLSTPSSLKAATTASSDEQKITESVKTLKKVLEREYISFFDPMRTEYYDSQVTFDDPMISLDGVASYQKNVDMLASRTLMGKFLFQDAGIVLHSIEGGELMKDGSLSDITTRWTLRVTASILPWKPTARFTGISVYKVVPSLSSDVGVQIVGQTDYWDSVNLLEGGSYAKVDKGLAIRDFLNQLSPGGFQAVAAGPEVPYQLMRRGSDYEVRRYPAQCIVKMMYGRRDEGFGSLGAFCKGMSPMAPASMTVNLDDQDDKYMVWPLTYAPPGETEAPVDALAQEKSTTEPQWRKCEVVQLPSRVIAVRYLGDLSMGPIVKKNDRLLRESLKRDGLKAKETGNVVFAQYDAIFSMGKRREECWVELEDGGHPY